MRPLLWDRRREIEQLRRDVWRYVTAAADSDDDVLMMAAALLDMPTQQVRVLAQIRFVLSPAVGALLDALPQLMQQLATTTANELESSQGEIRGTIRWGMTLSRRAASAGGDSFVTSQARRAYDTAENRLLAFALHEIHEQGRTLDWLGRARGKQADVVRDRVDRAGAALAQRALSGIATTEPDAVTVARVRHGRRRHRYAAVLDVVDVYEALVLRVDRDAVKDAVEQHALVTSSDATLFELRCLFGTVEALRAAGWEDEGDRLLQPPLVFSARRGEERIALYLRKAPTELTTCSRYLRTLRSHGFRRSHGLAPDLVIRHRRPDGIRWLLIEAKSYADPGKAVRRANADLLGYRHDFADQLDRQPEPYGIGCVYAAGLVPEVDAGVALCTPDRLPQALAAVGLG